MKKTTRTVTDEFGNLVEYVHEEEKERKRPPIIPFILLSIFLQIFFYLVPNQCH